ncbi:hypothetical protein EJB05_15026, partial [Eragrostis curvula]
MPLAAATTISIGYIGNVVVMIYAQRLTSGLPDPAVDLMYPGVVVFAVGIAGNFYHHYLLSRLRAAGAGDGDGKGYGYKIPRGGLFELVTCPHYLFEFVVFLGFAMIGQTVFALALACSVAEYLAGRSCATRRWYAAKFEEFPVRVKALVPDRQITCNKQCNFEDAEFGVKRLNLSTAKEGAHSILETVAFIDGSGGER